jgi:hypothetical protein
VDDARLARRLVKRGAQAIITNQIERIRDVTF